jgi:hypothetical protein
MKQRKFETALELLVMFYLFIIMVPILELLGILDHTHSNTLLELSIFSLSTINIFVILIGFFGLLFSIVSLRSTTFKSSDLYEPFTIIQTLFLLVGILRSIFGDSFDWLFYSPLFIVVLLIHVYKLKNNNKPQLIENRKKSHR